MINSTTVMFAISVVSIMVLVFIIVPTILYFAFWKFITSKLFIVINTRMTLILSVLGFDDICLSFHRKLVTNLQDYATRLSKVMTDLND